MSTPEEKMNLFNQYRQVYGDLDTSGVYKPGNRVKMNYGAVAEVIWVYQSNSGTTYVIDDKSGFPVEVSAREIKGRA